MSGLFVTGAGTDIGKTHVLCRLIAELGARGVTPRVLKPLVTGFDADSPETSDTGRLLAAIGAAVDAAAIDAVSPWRFAAPLSPDRAAEREHRPIDLADLVAASRPPPNDDGPTLVEGIGGVMVPIDAEHTVLDWIAALDYPTLLVTGTYLGSLSHTLTATLALRSRNVTLAALVISESPDPALELPEQKATLERFLPDVPIATLPRNASTTNPPLLDILQQWLPI